MSAVADAMLSGSADVAMAAAAEVTSSAADIHAAGETCRGRICESKKTLILNAFCE